MNPVFLFLVIAGTIFLWLIISPIFKELGAFFFGLWSGAMDEMKKTEENEEEQ